MVRLTTKTYNLGNLGVYNMDVFSFLPLQHKTIGYIVKSIRDGSL